MADRQALGEIVTVLETYFDGLHHSDIGRLGRVFHPAAHYVTVSDGTFLHRDMKTYFEVVEHRPSPASRGEARADEIVSIEFAGPVTARALVRCAIGPRRFIDLLTLIRLDGQWRIISKVFHFSEGEG
jgi:4-oxalocrotonate tautomerase